MDDDPSTLRKTSLHPHLTTCRFLTKKISRVELEHERLAVARGCQRVEVLEAQGRRVNAGNAVLLAELDKTTALKDKLSELCRALQAEIKATKEEAAKVKENALSAVDAEFAKRKQLSEEFSGTITSVQSKLEEQATARKDQLLENGDLRTKLTDLLGRFDEQQNFFDKTLQSVQT
jgi:hypothetical protein